MLIFNDTIFISESTPYFEDSISNLRVSMMKSLPYGYHSEI